MNILAIDFGTKNLGLAWVGSGVDVVLPYGCVDAKNWRVELPQLVLEERIGTVLVGIPYGPDGEETKNSERVRSFIKELGVLIKVPIETIDESFTTREAQSMEGDASLDEKSAMLILTEYIQLKKK
ncbi:MAG TPA: Holliday junction resolvase RuvX [Candidatus Magasanikbacteria bacterium]|nr:Holliday junction resolvase RuvX [Candidatus Magasanikbacteria bacterium]